MRKLLLLLFCFTTVVFALDFNATDENNETKSSPIVKQKSRTVFLSYEDTPKTVYVGELFAIKVKAIIANNNFESISHEFLDLENIEVLNKHSQWEWSSDNTFYNTFYMKAKVENAKLPSLVLNLTQQTEVIESTTIAPPKPDVIKLNGTKYFSGVIAKSLHVKQNKSSHFDEKTLIVVLEIEAKLANLNEFKLDWVKRDGIDSSRENLPDFNIYYYAIVPIYTKEFTFTYFNSEQNKFIKRTLPIIIIDDKISTQDDLNPSESYIEIYKDISYGLVAIFLLLIYIKKRKIVYLVLILILLTIYMNNRNPLEKVIIEEGSQIKILPTQKSTVFYTTVETIQAKKLDKKDDYTKILLPNGKIGWFKNGEN